jgi:hypothetical protein
VRFTRLQGLEIGLGADLDVNVEKMGRVAVYF